MTLFDLKEILEQTNLPVAYHHYEDAPVLPYIVYLFDNSDNFCADDIVYEKINNYRVELYSNKKDIEAESMLETVLDDAFLYYDKYEEFIKEEDLYMVVYELQM